MLNIKITPESSMPGILKRQIGHSDNISRGRLVVPVAFEQLDEVLSFLDDYKYIQVFNILMGVQLFFSTDN